VTAIEFGVLPVDELYAGALFFPFERASEVLHTWSALVQQELPDELMTWCTLFHFPPIPEVPAFARGRSFAVVMGAYLGTEAEGRDLLRPLRDLGPERDSFAVVPPVVLGDLAMDPLDPLPGRSGHELVGELPADAVDAVLAAVGPGSGRGETLTMLQFRQMGGALGRETPGAGARATLPGAISMFAFGVVPDPALEPAAHEAVTDVELALLPHRVGHYPNFVEEPADAGAFFEPERWARLREIKTCYDPDDLLVGNHHIPPAE
jgi:hypothetical protein